MDTIRRKKRAQSGLTRADMAKELGVEYNKYKAMERGEIKMPSKLMDKFNEIINKGKNVHTLERLDKQMDTKLNEILSERTGQPLEVIVRDTERDNFMTAAQAKDYGIVDQVIYKR